MVDTLLNFKKWIKAQFCILRGHDVLHGPKCPVTGVIKLTCSKCGATNVPKHEDKENRFK